MSPTERLYWTDPLAWAFDACVIARSTWGDQPTIVLDRTAFYPESGGQMADRGTISGRPVLDVQIDPDGRIHHLLDGPLPEPGEAVTAQVDEGRRRRFMACHTGQHLLSRALVDLHGADTRSARLGETACTVDVDHPGLSEADARTAEDLVNALVDRDLPVRAWFPTARELAALRLRRPPKVADGVRVVTVEGVDDTPCGGTHCASTAQVGLLRIEGLERYKGGTRLTFDAGSRAREAVFARDDGLRSLARALGCAPADVAERVAALRGQLGDAQAGLGDLRVQLAEALAARLVAEAGPGATEVVAALPGVDREVLKAVASRLCEEPGMLALLAAPAPDGAAVVVKRGDARGEDCGALLRRLATDAGGRGGGRPPHAEGRLPADVDWPALVTRALADPR